MKIGQLAQTTGTQAETIRYYERLGLLAAPTRTHANYRVYGEDHIERLAFIRHCRCLDMTLDEIRILLQFKDAPSENCGEVDRLLDEHIGHVVLRVRELKALEKELRGLRRQCTRDRSARDCGILDGLEKAARAHDHMAKGHDRHVRGTHKEVGMTAAVTRLGRESQKKPAQQAGPPRS